MIIKDNYFGNHLYKYFEKLSENKKSFTDALTLETEKIAFEHNFGIRDNDTIELMQLTLIKNFQHLAKKNYTFENFDATKIRKSDFYFPKDFPEYPLLTLEDMVISLDLMPKGYNAKIETFFIEKKIDDYITLSYSISSSYATIALKLKNSRNNFIITCFNEDKIHLKLEPIHLPPKKPNILKDTATKMISYLQNINKSKDTLEKFEHIKKMLISVQKISCISNELSSKILFENKKVTKEELDILDLLQDGSLSNSEVGNFLIEVKMDNIFINIEDHINHKKIIKPKI